MSRPHRGRGRGQGEWGRGKRLGGLTLSSLTIQSDSSSTHQEDVSSLSDLSSSALEKVDLSKESTFMKVWFLLGLNSHLTLYTCPSSTAAIVQGVRDDQKEVCFDRVTKYTVVCQLS